MPDRILHKRNFTSGNLPTTASLEVGELAINVADGKIHLRRSGSSNNDIVSLVTANTITTGSITATSFSGSLFGTSSWAQDAVTSSYALTASFALNGGGGGSSFPFTGSAIITGSLDVIGSVGITGSLDVSQGITGSLYGTSSWALNAQTASYVESAQTASYILNAVSASFAQTASYLLGYISPFPFSGSAQITGSLGVTGSFIIADGSNIVIDSVNRVLKDSSGINSISWNSRRLADTNATTSIDWDLKKLNDGSDITSINWESRRQSDSTGVSAVDWGQRQLNDTSGLASTDWTSRIHYDSTAISSVNWETRQLLDSTETLVLDWNNKTLTASLHGTASWAENALTASHLVGGITTNTGSLLSTASVSLNTITFTKGDGSTFPITVDTGSGGSTFTFNEIQRIAFLKI